MTVTGNRAEPVTTLPFPVHTDDRLPVRLRGGRRHRELREDDAARLARHRQRGGRGRDELRRRGRNLQPRSGRPDDRTHPDRRNRLRLARPNAIVASGGGITTHGRLSLSDSIVSDNSVAVDAELPDDVGTASFSGGIEVTNVADATIVRMIVRGNSVRMTNVGGSVRAAWADQHRRGRLARSPRQHDRVEQRAREHHGAGRVSPPSPVGSSSRGQSR